MGLKYNAPLVNIFVVLHLAFRYSTRMEKMIGIMKQIYLVHVIKYTLVIYFFNRNVINYVTNNGTFVYHPRLGPLWIPPYFRQEVQSLCKGVNQEESSL